MIENGYFSLINSCLCCIVSFCTSNVSFRNVTFLHADAVVAAVDVYFMPDYVMNIYFLILLSLIVLLFQNDHQFSASCERYTIHSFSISNKST